MYTDHVIDCLQALSNIQLLWFPELEPESVVQHKLDLSGNVAAWRPRDLRGAAAQLSRQHDRTDETEIPQLHGWQGTDNIPDQGTIQCLLMKLLNHIGVHIKVTISWNWYYFCVCVCLWPNVEEKKSVSRSNFNWMLYHFHFFQRDVSYNAYEKDIAIVNIFFGDSTVFGII